MNSAAPIGIFLGPLIGGPIADRWGFRTILGINALLMLIVVLALSLGYRDHFKGGERKPLLQMAGDSLRLILGSRRLRALFPALFVLFAGWMLANTYIPVVISQLYPGPDQGTRVGLIMGAGGLVAPILAPLLGILADRYGHWRFLFAGAILEVFLWPLPALVHGLTAFGAAWALINGLASAIFAISFSVLAGSTTDETRGRVMSFAYLPVNIGGIVGPAIGSIVTRGSLLAIFPTAAVLTALGIGLLALAARQAE
jgi:DHA1 family multidrug resistance protein-like MFS transporter